jgi:hypothetical protein
VEANARSISGLRASPCHSYIAFSRDAGGKSAARFIMRKPQGQVSHQHIRLIAKPDAIASFMNCPIRTLNLTG